MARTRPRSLMRTTTHPGRAQDARPCPKICLSDTPRSEKMPTEIPDLAHGESSQAMNESAKGPQQRLAGATFLSRRSAEDR